MNNIYCDPNVITNLDILLRDYGVIDEHKEMLKDAVYYGSPMRAADSYKQHVEFSMAMVKAFLIGYEYAKNGGVIIENKMIKL